MPKPTIKTNRVIHAPQVLDAFTKVLCRHLPLELQETRTTADDIWKVLSYATSHRTFIESACSELEGAPSGNRLREVLSAALPASPDLQRQLNTALRAQLPRSLLKGKRSYALAIDITQIPYHGQPQHEEDEVMRGEAKSGTTCAPGGAVRTAGGGDAGSGAAGAARGSTTVTGSGGSPSLARATGPGAPGVRTSCRVRIRPASRRG